MSTFIALVDYTEKGIGNIQDSPKRADALTELAAKMGIEIKGIYWTSGAHDGFVILDAPDSSTAAALMLSIGRQGNIRTQTLRAYGRDEMEAILAKAK